MVLLKTLVLSALALSLSLVPTFAQDASTTRIETRPVYGSVMVTYENGVRVFRPLPPTRHVIVNPDGETPLALSFSESRVYKRTYRESRHYHDHRYSGYRSGVIGGRTLSNVHQNGY